MGSALTPDDKELWLTDAFNKRLHIFDATVMPPKQVGRIELRDEPGWITFSIDGRLAYPSTGDVIDARTRKIVATLKDETGRDVQSEKMLEIDFRGTKPVRAGDQFGFGRPGVATGARGAEPLNRSSSRVMPDGRPRRCADARAAAPGIALDQPRQGLVERLAAEVQADDRPLGIDQVGRRDRAHAECLDEVARAAARCDLRPGDLPRLDEVDHGILRLVEADADDLEARVVIGAIRRLEPRQLGDAWPAPGRPEVQRGRTCRGSCRCGSSGPGCPGP